MAARMRDKSKYCFNYVNLLKISPESKNSDDITLEMTIYVQN